MGRLTQVLTAGLLCCAMAFSAAAQERGGNQGRGEKKTRTIEREPKGDRGNQGDRNRGGQDRNSGDNNRGGKDGRDSGKRNRPNDGF